MRVPASLPHSHYAPNRRRTIFIGDIHGCCAEFEALLKAVEFAPGRDRLLLTGDAFTRGPDPLGVWQAIRATSA